MKWPTLALITLFALSATPISADKEKTKQNAKQDSKKGDSKQTKNAKELTLQEAMTLVARRNLGIQWAAFEAEMSDTQQLIFEKKYAPTLSLDGSYAESKDPETSTSSFFGDEHYQLSAEAALSKLFASGTHISVGARSSYSDSNDAGFGTVAPDPAYHKPALFVRVQQELLRNAFGYADRKRSEILHSQAEIRRQTIFSHLSKNLVRVLAEYWHVNVSRSQVEIAELELSSTRNLLGIVRQNVRFGIAETFQINYYKSLAKQAESKLAMAKKKLRDARRTLLASIHKPEDTVIAQVTGMTDELPDLEVKASTEAAFAKRIDWQNALRRQRNARIEIKLRDNEALPSMKAYAEASSRGQDEDIFAATGDVSTARYPSWKVGLRVTYPLWDKEIKANARNARIRLRQENIRLEELRHEIKNEVASRLEQVQLAHQLLINSREVRKESEIYYRRLVRRSRQGKFDSVAVKSALDAMIQSRQQELVSLVQYNVDLLKFDLSKNEVLEKYNVDVAQMRREFLKELANVTEK